jgi:hypothetical protein
MYATTQSIALAATKLSMSLYNAHRIILAFIFLCSLAKHNYGQTVTMNKNESPESFVRRVVSDGDLLSFQVMETKEWTTPKLNFLSFYTLPNEMTLGVLLVPIDEFTYKKILIDTFRTNGGRAHVNSIFFANVDGDSANELVVMTTYYMSMDGIHSEKIYQNMVFDNPDLTKGIKQLNYLIAVSQRIDGERFKKSEDIRAELSKSTVSR